jgi:hypothetical protein
MTAPSPSPELESGAQAEPAVSERRRRLLKAALRTAPLVLTLPSGAALANTSAYQCIASSRARSVGSGSSAPQVVATLDHWERVVVPKYKYTFKWVVTWKNPDPPGNTTTREVSADRERFAVPAAGNPGNVIPDPENNSWLLINPLLTNQQLEPVKATTYRSDGGDDPDPTLGPNESITSGPELVATAPVATKAYALAFFQPTDSPADTDVPYQPYSWYPHLKSEQLTSVAEGAPTALDGSCFCSVNPGSASGRCGIV